MKEITTRAEIMAVITQLAGQASMLTIPRLFVEITGDLNSALLLNQIVFWTGKGRLGETIYKTYRQWEQEIFLKRSQCETAKKRLEKLGMIDTAVYRAGGSPTVHYRLNYEKLVAAIEPVAGKASFRNGNVENKKSIAENQQMETLIIRKHSIIPLQKMTAVDHAHTQSSACEKISLSSISEPEDKERAHKKAQAHWETAEIEAGAVGAGFKKFWADYPKKRSKAAAEAAWTRLAPSGEMVDYILTGLSRIKKSKDWRVEGGRYVPFPAKWLEVKGWEDEECEVPRVSKYSTGPMEWLEELEEKLRQRPGEEKDGPFTWMDI